MAPSEQPPRDIRQLMCLLQTIKCQIESQANNTGHFAPSGTIQIPTGLPPKEYGPTNLSDQAQAVLGDVYNFYDHDQASQRLILQEFKEQMETFCQRQDKRDENMQRALLLLTEFNQGLRSKPNKSEQGSNLEPFTQKLSVQQLLTIITPKDREQSAEQTLELCLSIAQRRQSQLTFVKPSAYMPAINQWLSSRGSMLLHIISKSPAEDHMTDTVVQLTKLLRDSENPTIWSLPVGSEHNDMQLILHDILSQRQRIQSDATIETRPGFNATNLEQPLQKEAWNDILRAVLASTKTAFFILNLPRRLSQTSQAEEEDVIGSTIDTLTTCVKDAEARNNIIKVLLHTSSIDSVQGSQDSASYITCSVDAIPTNIALARRSSAQARSLTRQSLLTPVLSND